ncbi:Gfo/Idh/MocA family oxidoreductase [Aureimonas altamirensis]|uniref:Gfo/Idh/MocA family protein n=1 Tax=Aureimonas altamirensis TaxID=370622 RepID=UPI00301684A5
MSKVRLGLVGLGMASAPHAASLKELAHRVTVAGVYSPSAARREAFAARHGFPTVDDIDDLIGAPDIDAILLLTPPSTHLELVRRAAGAGQHILLEKPLETSLQRAEELVATADAASITLAVVLQRRHRRSLVEAQTMLSQGELGEIVSASARIANWRPQSYYDEPGRGTLARDGGGVLLTQAIHTLDQLIALAGMPGRVAAFATTSLVHRMETEDLVQAVLHYESGALGSISATTAAYPGFEDEIEILATKGSIRLQANGARIALKDGTERRIDDDGADGGSGADPMAFSHANHRAVLEDFLTAVETGRQPRVSGRDALRVHRLIDMLLASAADGGRPVAQSQGE